MSRSGHEQYTVFYCCMWIIKFVILFTQALTKGNPLLGDISRAMLNVTGGDAMIQLEKKWIGFQNDCQNVGPVTGSGSLTFANFKGLFILTGAASTSSVLMALIIYIYKKKQRSTKIMKDDSKLVDENKTNVENNEPQEENQGVKEEAHLRSDIEEDDQTREQNGSEQVSN
jgi:glutamate receptor, ionotropic, plant